MELSSVLILVGYAILAVVLVRFIRFITTPMLRRMGIYRYYSPMFLTMPFGRRTLELHLGTSWDFFRRGELTQLALMNYLGKGLVGLLESVELGIVRHDTRLRGTMCFLSAETMHRIGFQTRKMNVLESMLFLINYPEICLLQSLVKRRLTLVPWKQVRMFEADVSDLLVAKERLLTIVRRLEHRCNALSGKCILPVKPGGELPTLRRRLTSTTGDTNGITYEVWRSVDAP